ncbi:MAG: hypothetical protein RJQ07_12530, partial [Pseudomonadales bacterium]
MNFALAVIIVVVVDRDTARTLFSKKLSYQSVMLGNTQCTGSVSIYDYHDDHGKRKIHIGSFGNKNVLHS